MWRYRRSEREEREGGLDACGAVACDGVVGGVSVCVLLTRVFEMVEAIESVTNSRDEGIRSVGLVQRRFPLCRVCCCVCVVRRPKDVLRRPT